MGEKTHAGSKTYLLGENPKPELVELFSNEKQVTDKTPPTFLTHAIDDKAVPVENSRQLVEALKSHNIPVGYLELPNGAGMCNQTDSSPMMAFITVRPFGNVDRMRRRRISLPRQSSSRKAVPYLRQYLAMEPKLITKKMISMTNSPFSGRLPSHDIQKYSLEGGPSGM